METDAMIKFEKIVTVVILRQNDFFFRFFDKQAVDLEKDQHILLLFLSRLSPE